MATEHSTQETAARELTFTASVGIYQLNPEASDTELCDQLAARLDQLSAMLTIVTGNGFETFSRWNDEIQCNYLWACNMISDECRDLVNHANFSLVSKPSQEEA